MNLSPVSILKEAHRAHEYNALTPKGKKPPKSIEEIQRRRKRQGMKGRNKDEKEEGCTLKNNKKKAHTQLRVK